MGLRLRELRRDLEALYGERLQGVLPYGSYVRGDAEAGSDVDVLVVLEGPVDAGQEIARLGPISAALSL